jgi:hypothetical protein
MCISCIIAVSLSNFMIRYVAPASIATFTQSTALYIGGDAAKFNARYPAPLISYKLKWLPRP